MTVDVPAVFPADAAVAVLLPVRPGRAYDYRVPPGQSVVPGQVVKVRLGPRPIDGVVWGPGDSGLPREKLRPIEAVHPVPPIPASLRRLIDWAATYTLTPPGLVLRMAISIPDALPAPRPRTALSPTGTAPPRMTEARARVLAAAAEDSGLTAADLARAAEVSGGVVRGLVDAGCLTPVTLPAEDDLPPPTADPDRAGPALTPDQDRAAARLVERVDARAFHVALLDGVTGSGKTEVYFEAVAAALKAGRQVLVLLPEIALTAQWFARFAARFGVAPVEWHSDLTQATRRRAWRQAAFGTAQVVVGARSALFLPFADLGLVVIDEEHDPSFKQEDGVLYQARDLAVVRAKEAGCPIVLASATPSLETVANVQARKYEVLALASRYGGAALPRIETVDLRATPPHRGMWLAPPLVAAIEAALARGEQALVFLNRRGYAPLTLCRACGHRIECPQCSAWMVEHRVFGRLMCHHCGHSMPTPSECPQCGAEDSLVACGPGVERIDEELAARFPDAARQVMASDTLQGPTRLRQAIEAIGRGKIDLIVGTQVMAKGYHFPNLTVIGVVDADLGLGGGDLRAAERTFQLLHQVAGRAGRAADKPGRVLLQSHQPEHPVIQALATGDRDAFQRAELAARQRSGMPPYGRLVALIVSGPSEEEVRAVAGALGRRAPRAPGLEVLGPAEAPLKLLRGRVRYRLLLRADRSVRVQETVRGWVARTQIPSAVRVAIDVDPYSFL